MHIPSKTPIIESPAWSKYQADKEAALRMKMKDEDHSWQWEQWLEKVQIRAIDNFTDNGWGMDSMPEATHKVIHDHFRKAWDSGDVQEEPGTFAGRVTGTRKLVSKTLHRRAQHVDKQRCKRIGGRHDRRGGGRDGRGRSNY